MKITKELLEHLNVVSISLQNKDKNILCFLERIENNFWTFQITEKPDSLDKKVIFSVHFVNDDIIYDLRAILLDSGENWLKVELTQENILDTKLVTLLQELSKMENRFEQFGRRKEERIKIGKYNAAEFGLTKLEQNIFLHGIKVIQPCVILDVSVHGICIITPETPAIRNLENNILCIKILFENPTQTVILKAHSVYSKLNKTENKNYLTLCCQLLEPIHFAWKERVISMVSKIDS